eukprot:6340459-Alexandrium_andersonii.AAC.1
MPCCFASFSAADRGTPADGFGRPEPRRYLLLRGSGGSGARGRGGHRHRALASRGGPALRPQAPPPEGPCPPPRW